MSEFAPSHHRSRPRSRPRRTSRSKPPPDLSASMSDYGRTSHSSHDGSRSPNQFCAGCGRNTSCDCISSRFASHSTSSPHKSKRKVKRRGRSSHRSHKREEPPSRVASGTSGKPCVSMWELDGEGYPRKHCIGLPDSCLNGFGQRRSQAQPGRRVQFAEFADLYYF